MSCATTFDGTLSGSSIASRLNDFMYFRKNEFGDVLSSSRASISMVCTAAFLPVDPTGRPEGLGEGPPGVHSPLGPGFIRFFAEGFTGVLAGFFGIFSVVGEPV